MQHIGKFQPPPEPSKKTERGELLKEFAEKLSKPIGYVAMRLKGFSVQDMYYIRSIAEDGARRGEPWAKVFYGSLKVKPKENE